jgi:hypothetical protein
MAFYFVARYILPAEFTFIGVMIMGSDHFNFLKIKEQAGL